MGLANMTNDHAVNMREALRNATQRRKGSMGLANMTNDHAVKMWEGWGNATQRRKGSMGKTFLAILAVREAGDG